MFSKDKRYFDHAPAWNNKEQFTTNSSVGNPNAKAFFSSGIHSNSLILEDDCADNHEEENIASNEVELGVENVQQNYILDDRLPVETNLYSDEVNKIIMNNRNNHSLLNTEEPPYEEFHEDAPMAMDQGTDEPNNDNYVDNYLDEGQYYDDEEEPYEDIDSPPPETPQQEVHYISPSHPPIDENNLSSIMICTDPPFTEEDIDNFLNGCHSKPHDKIGVKNYEQSTSNSGKRKNNEGIDDTTSYDPTVNEKPKC